MRPAAHLRNRSVVQHVSCLSTASARCSLDSVVVRGAAWPQSEATEKAQQISLLTQTGQR
jgi:hypothetical protein